MDRWIGSLIFISGSVDSLIINIYSRFLDSG